MTREEAIEIIKRVDICANAAETARDMAIDALKKQMPQKPIPHKVDATAIIIGSTTWCKGTTVHKCPCCSSFISKLYSFCFKCGQAFDWGKDDEST